MKFTLFLNSASAADLDKTIEDYALQLIAINKKIAALRNKEYGACKVIVIFNEEPSQRKCLDEMSLGVIPAMLNQTSAIRKELLYNGNVLHVAEAPEVSTSCTDFFFIQLFDTML